MKPLNKLAARVLLAAAAGRGLMNYACRQAASVPEPWPLALMSLGLAGMALARRRKQNPTVTSVP